MPVRCVGIDRWSSSDAPYLLAPELEPEAPAEPEPEAELPDVPPVDEVDPEPLAPEAELPPSVSHLFCAHLASVGFRSLHASRLLLPAAELPEVLPLVPMELEVLPELPSDEPDVPDEPDEPSVLPEVPLAPSDEPDVPAVPEALTPEALDPLMPPVEPLAVDDVVPLADVPLPYCDEALLVLLGVALCDVVVVSDFLFLFMSPSARAEPLARATIEVRMNAGASLRMVKPPSELMVG